MKVKWIEYPKIPTIDSSYFEEYMKIADSVPVSLIVVRQGEVVSTKRTFWGNWKFLVLCEDNQLREVDKDEVIIIDE